MNEDFEDVTQESLLYHQIKMLERERNALREQHRQTTAYNEHLSRQLLDREEEVRVLRNDVLRLEEKLGLPW